MEGTHGKRDKRISHINHQLPVMFSIFSLILLYKVFIKKDISRCD